MKFLEEAIAKIEAAQPKEHTAVWCVGEQLKDILRAEPQFAELVCQDLDNPEMKLEMCEALIKARADELHKKNEGSCSCVTGREAEEIIRKFYGLGKAGTPEHRKSKADDEADTENAGKKVLRLEDFF